MTTMRRLIIWGNDRAIRPAGHESTRGNHKERAMNVKTKIKAGAAGDTIFWGS